MNMKSLGDRLLEAGAPVLKSVVDSAIGGKLAGAAIDALAESLQTDPTPEAIVAAIGERWQDPRPHAPAVTTTDTKIITTDSVAMHELAATLEASNTILSENNILRKEEHADRWANRNTDTME
jgi:hypothetical protein